MTRNFLRILFGTSLQRRLVLALLAVLLVGGAFASLGLYWLAMRQQGEIFDERLRALSFNLPVEAMLEMPRGVNDEAADGIVVQVWRSDGTLLWTSEARPAPISTQIGMSDVAYGNDRWRSFTRIVRPSGLVLQVTQALDVRERHAAAEALRLLVPLLVLVPVLVLLTGGVVANQLGPLRKLAAQMQQRAAQDTSPVVLEHAPRELEPVLSSLNDLLSRQAQASQRQRDFLADVAHELRTPLAAVSLQAQRAGMAADEAERREALDALHGGIERSTHLVAQLLSLARSESIPDVSMDRAVLLEPLLREVVAQRFPLAQARGLDLGIANSSPTIARGDAEALTSLLGNLVDNAIAYTPAPGRIDVSLDVEAGEAVILVEDTGPGIDPARQATVFERFVRGGTGDVAGTGLGLAIAHGVVLRHRGRIELKNRTDGSGLRVTVRLPVA